MRTAAVILAIIGTLGNHYAFSFQRFTLLIARQYSRSIRDIAALQLLMTPVAVGAVGWIVQPLRWGAALLIGLSWSWWLAVGYLVADLFLFGAIMPLFPLRNHFAGLALKQLGRSMREADPGVVARLMVDVWALKKDPDPSGT